MTDHTLPSTPPLGASLFVPSAHQNVAGYSPLTPGLHDFFPPMIWDRIYAMAGLYTNKQGELQFMHPRPNPADCPWHAVIKRIGGVLYSSSPSPDLQTEREAYPDHLFLVRSTVANQRLLINTNGVGNYPRTYRWEGKFFSWRYAVPFPVYPSAEICFYDSDDYELIARIPVPEDSLFDLGYLSPPLLMLLRLGVPLNDALSYMRYPFSGLNAQPSSPYSYPVFAELHDGVEFEGVCGANMVYRSGMPLSWSVSGCSRAVLDPQGAPDEPKIEIVEGSTGFIASPWLPSHSKWIQRPLDRPMYGALLMLTGVTGFAYTPPSPGMVWSGKAPKIYPDMFPLQ